MPLPSQRKGAAPYAGSLVSGRNLSRYVGRSVGILARVKQVEEDNLLLMEAADGTEVRCRLREGEIPTQKWLHVVGEVLPQLVLEQRKDNPAHFTLPQDQPLDSHTVEEATFLVTHPRLQHLFKGYY